LTHVPARQARRQARRLALGALGATLVLAASACGSGSGASSASGHITLTVWSYYSTPAQIEALKAQDELFEKAHSNVTVDEVQVTSNLDEKLLAAAASHDGPDVVLNNVVIDFPELTSAGVLYPLTKFWNAYPDKSQFPAAGIWRGTNGQIYNVMSYTNLLGLYYNKTILDQYHLTPPATVSELVADMKVITKAGKYTALAASAEPQTDGAWTWFPLLLEQGTNYCDMTASDSLPMFQTVASWTAAGYLPKEAATWTQSDSWTAFMSGKYAFGINGNWDLGDARQASFAWGTAQYPAGPNGSRVFPGGEGLGIGAYSKYPALDWEYLETSWLSSQGSTIDFTDSGQIPTRTDVADTPTVQHDAVAAPFIAASKTVSPWPRSAETQQMQVTVATELSDVVSGQATPAAAAQAAASQVQAEIKSSNNVC
jgi:ABC-type glycerol-3-phosphate transport system substrate-binding protein